MQQIVAILATKQGIIALGRAKGRTTTIKNRMVTMDGNWETKMETLEGNCKANAILARNLVID
jgi:hypothetical protein